MKYRMLHTRDMIYVELESDPDAWNLIYSSSSGWCWHMEHLDDSICTDYFVDFNTLSDEEFFQMQLVLDTHGYDMLTIGNIQKAVNEFKSKNNYEVGAYYDLEVQ